MRIQALKQIAIRLNEGDVVWGVGGSVLLSEYGLVAFPRDIDLIIQMNDCEKALNILDRVADRIYTESKPPFKTACFQKYELDGELIDVMAGFAIEHENGIYRMEFDNESITKCSTLRNVLIPFTSLEDWFVLYQLIPNKGEKATLIESFWEKDGIEYPAILKKALKQPLPAKVQKRCDQALLKDLKEGS